MDQTTIISALRKNKSAFGQKISRINFEETHISWIFLTGKHAYKIKKELKFGNVLDFSNIRLRKKYCQQEVLLNRLLCGDMYERVVKLVHTNDLFHFVELNRPGHPIEYAVKMREIPQKFRMDNLLKKNKITKQILTKLALKLVSFHRKTHTSSRIKNFGKPSFILKKINENFRTLETLTSLNPKYEKKLINFVKENRKLFSRRIEKDRIRDIHGDLYLRNIFVENNKKLYLYDRIEFNESLRSADVVEDVAHFAMDLDFYKRQDLSDFFISEYIKISNDYELSSLVYFWMCYKACMRAKVSFFQAKNEKNKSKKKTQLCDAKFLLRIAESYLELF